MKKLVFSLLATSFIAIACDEVSNPYPEPEFVGDCDPAFNDTIYNDTTIDSRKITLEDFTGQQCPNCPEAADISQDLFEAHPDQIIPIAIHNSLSFSEPDPAAGYPLDLQTETGENMLYTYQPIGFPSGLINRSELGGSFNQSYQTWVNTINMLLGDDAYMAQRFDIKMQVIYNSDCRVVRIYPTVNVMQSLTGSYYMVGFILEDGIIGKQKDNRAPNGYVDPYEHKHVLRGGFPNNGAGSLIFTDPVLGDNYTAIEEDESIAIQLADDWVDENLSVVFFIRDLDSGEIFGADMVHIGH